MLKCVSLLVLMLLLAACDEGYAPAYDPALAAQDANATIAVTTAIAESERKAVRKTEAAQEYSAAETQRVTKEEMELLQRRQEATDVALDGERTSTAIAWGMETTRTAVAQQVAQSTVQAGATATAFVQTQTPVYATLVAGANAVALEQRRQNIRVVSLWAWTIAAPIIAIILTAGAAVGIYLFLNWLLEMKSLEGRLVAKNGRVIFLHSLDPKVRDYDPQLIGGPQFLELPPGRIRDAEPDGVFPLDTAGNVLASPMKSRKVSARWVVPLMDAAIKAGYENSSVFPGHRELDWSGWAWQEAISWLRLAHIISSQPGKATITHPEFQTVGELRWAIEEGNLMPNLFKKREKADAA